MLFNSVAFLLAFLPASLLLYSYAKQVSRHAAMLVLLVASLLFYSWWDWRFTPLLMGSIALNYAYGRILEVHRTRTHLWIGIALNLLPLSFFKYAGWLTGMAGVPIQSLVLPLGISFYTFLQIGYLVGIYRGTLIRQGFLPYAVFATYFPHLIAGPILDHNEVTAQLQAIDRRPLELGQAFARGTLLLVVGLFKKVVIADAGCAGIANMVFASAQSANFTEAWTGALAYTAQLYFDFSGYCEMALGMSLMMGIHIPVNFHSPYRSRNIAEFWRSWHISLSRWFRDFVYIPLGGNRGGVLASLGALWVTFAATGLWHGAGWTFVLWGCLHGAYITLYRSWPQLGCKLPRSVATTVTLLAVIFAWVLFRASTLSDALALWTSMAGINGITLGYGFAPFAPYLPSWVAIADTRAVIGTEVLLYGLLLAWCASAKNVHEFDLQPTLRHVSYVGGLFLVALLAIGQGSTFLYFSF